MPNTQLTELGVDRAESRTLFKRMPNHVSSSAPLCSPAQADLAIGNVVQGFRRAIYIALAITSLLLGIIGIVLPGLPTTPFLLLASYLLSQSSPQMHQRLLANRFLGPILRQWQEHRTVEPHVKRRACVLVVVSIALLVYFSSPAPMLTALILVFASIGLFIISRLPVAPKNALQVRQN